MKAMCAFFVSVALLFGMAFAEDAAPKKPEPANTKIKVGDKAPDFTLPKPSRPEGSNDTVKLSDLKGKKNVLVAFYPKAFTSGCTKQMCGYRDDFSKFTNADTDIVAVSIDKQDESDRFKKQYNMPFSLLGDPDHKVVDAYGILLAERNGTKYAQRSVVLVDKQGVVRYVNMDYKIGQDEKPLFDAVEALKKPGEPQPKQG